MDAAAAAAADDDDDAAVDANAAGCYSLQAPFYPNQQTLKNFRSDVRSWVAKRLTIVLESSQWRKIIKTIGPLHSLDHRPTAAWVCMINTRFIVVLRGGETSQTALTGQQNPYSLT